MGPGSIPDDEHQDTQEEFDDYEEGRRPSHTSTACPECDDVSNECCPLCEGSDNYCPTCQCPAEQCEFQE